MTSLRSTMSPDGDGDGDGEALYAQPSDVALVNDFLRPWVTSGDTMAGGGGAGAYVHAADLYSANPEVLARRFQPAVSVDGEHVWYFLSPLRNRSPRDRRKVRAVADGTGCWHSEAAPKKVFDTANGDRHVGYRQSFSFMQRRDAAVDVRDGWIMAEFHLYHDGLRRKVEGLVLCKMYRSPRNHGPAVAADSGNDNEVSNAVMARRQGHSKNTDGMATTEAMASHLLTKKAVGDDEVFGMTMAMAPCPKKKMVAADDEDLLVSPPAHKKMRVTVAADDEDLLVARKKMGVAVAEAESPSAALALKATAAGAASVAAQLQLQCPRCRFHLAALQALVTLPGSMWGLPQRTPSHGILE